MEKSMDYNHMKRFGLSDNPFLLSPDPFYYFPASPHEAARNVLKYGIERGEGFMVLSGPAGTGKTLLLRTLLENLHPDKQTAVVLTPSINPEQLLHMLLRELGCSRMERSSSMPDLFQLFQECLLEQACRGKEIVIVVDEAQLMPLDTLEGLRLLSNLETNNRKLIQIILSGQPELEEILQDPRLGQLTQRITVIERLRPLTLRETSQYVTYRLAKAGRPDLTPSYWALRLLHRRSKGIPRLINRLMDRSLLMAASHNLQTIGLKHVWAASSTLPQPEWDEMMPQGFAGQPAEVALIAAMVVLGLATLKEFGIW